MESSSRSSERERNPNLIAILDLSWKGGSNQAYEANQQKNSKIERLSSLRDYPNLKVLDLSGNRITNVSNLEHLDELSRLEELNLSRNILRRLSPQIAGLKQLQRLDLSHNFLTEIPKELAALNQLKWLHLGGNKIVDVTLIKRLKPCTHLANLSLFGNPITFNSSYRATVISILSESLRFLDDVKVSTRERDASSILVQGSKEKVNGKPDRESILQVQELSTRSSLLEEELVGMKKTFVAKERNHDDAVQKLRSELEATSQLLVRKTADWAKAEETASALRQELAFYKIDHPVRVERVSQEATSAPIPFPSPTGKNVDDPEAEIISSRNDVITTRPFDPQVVFSLFTSPGVAAQPTKEQLEDPTAALVQLEEQVKRESKQMQARLKELRNEFEVAEATRLATRKALLKAREKLEGVRIQYNKARKDASKFIQVSGAEYMAGKGGLDIVTRDRLLDLQSKLEENASVLKELIVMRTEALLGSSLQPTREHGLPKEDANPDEDLPAEMDDSQKSEYEVEAIADVVEGDTRTLLTDSGEQKIRKLEDQHARIVHDIFFKVHEVQNIPGLDLNSIDFLRQKKSLTDSNGESQKLSLYNVGVTRLAKEWDECEKFATLIMSRLEHLGESTVRSPRMDIVNAKDFSTSSYTEDKFGNNGLEKGGDEDVEDAGTSAVLSDTEMAHISLSSMGALLNAEEATEATIANEYNQRMEYVRTLEMKILSLEREWATRENVIRITQVLLSAHAVQQMESVLDTHSRTIMRLEERLDDSRHLDPPIGPTRIDNYIHPQGVIDLQDHPVSASSKQPPGSERGGNSDSSVDDSLLKPVRPPSGVAMVQSGALDPLASNNPSSTPSSSSSNAAATSEELNLKTLRKRLYEELLEGERQYLHNLHVMVEVILMPMRRRGLLKPREMQLVMNNTARLVVLHTNILNGLEERRSVQVVLRTMARFIPDFSLYGRYCNGYPASVAIVACRRHELHELHDFLEVCSSREECLGRDILDFLRMPIERVNEYVGIFQRLSQLSSTVENADYHRGILKVNELLRHATQKMDLSLDRLHEEAKVSALFHRFVPGRHCDAMDLNDFLRQHNQKLCFSTSASVLLPGCNDYRHCSVFVCTEGVVIGHVPTNWSPEFDGHRPKLVVDGAFRFRLVAPQPIDPADSCSVVLNVQRIPVNENRSSLDVTEAPDEPAMANIRIRSGSLQPIESLMDSYVIECTDEEEAVALQSCVDRLKSRWLARRSNLGSPKRGGRSVVSEQDARSVFGESSRFKEVSLLPGTDMQQRRTMAAELRQRRGSWAVENSSHSKGQRLFPVESVDGVNPQHAVWDEYDFGSEQDDEYLSKLRGECTPTRLRQRSEGRHREYTKRQPSPFVVVAFGSRVPPEEAKRMLSPKKKGARTPKRSPRSQASHTDRFDADSPYNPMHQEDAELSSDPRRIDFEASTGTLVVEEKGGLHRSQRAHKNDKIDLSIFKAPQPKNIGNMHDDEWTSRYTQERFIGLPWKESEYIKQRNKVEEALSSPRKR